MFLVVIHWFWNNSDRPLILARTRDKAEEFVKEYEGARQLGGFAEYKVEEVNIFD